MTDEQATVYDAASRQAFENGGHEGLANYFRENPPFAGTKASIEILAGAGMIRLAIESKAVLSRDGVKTVFSNGKYEVKVDNLFNYYRVKNLSTNQYVNILGKSIKTGSLRGKDAKNYLQQQTHFKNLD